MRRERSHNWAGDHTGAEKSKQGKNNKPRNDRVSSANTTQQREILYNKLHAGSSRKVLLRAVPVTV
jgi:hypothetical protein